MCTQKIIEHMVSRKLRLINIFDLCSHISCSLLNLHNLSFDPHNFRTQNFFNMKATIAIALLLSFAYVDVTNGGRLFLSDEEKRRLSKGSKGVKAYEPVDGGRILAEKAGAGKAEKMSMPHSGNGNSDCMKNCLVEGTSGPDCAALCTPADPQNRHNRHLANDCGVCMSGCNDETTDPTPEECREACKSGDCSPNGSGGGGKSGKSGGGGYGRDRN